MAIALVLETSAQRKAAERFRRWAIEYAADRTFGALVLFVGDCMDYTVARDPDEKVVMARARTIGWSSVLREIASLLDEIEALPPGGAEET